MTDQKQTWAGPSILSYGFRPFFLGASSLSALAMGLWIAMLSGHMMLPTAFDPVAWHAHEFMFGYLGAVIAGFLLTAVPSWTGRLPIVGWTLGALAGVWIAGRLAIAMSAMLPPVLVAIIDLALPFALACIVGREIIKGKNWRNLMILALLAVFGVGNALFHWEAMQGGAAAQGMGLRIGLGGAIMMIAVIGGRIVPIFTHNWLAKRGDGPRPSSPMKAFDKVALVVLAVSLVSWVALPAHAFTGIGLVVSGLLHIARLTRWVGYRCLAEPLVAVLHIGYAFLPAGGVLMGLDILMPGVIGTAAAQHLWMGGAVGVMTLAVMTRATLGHTGHVLKASAMTTIMYLALIAAVLARVAAGSFGTDPNSWLVASGALWIAAFSSFILEYFRPLVQPGLK